MIVTLSLCNDCSTAREHIIVILSAFVIINMILLFILIAPPEPSTCSEQDETRSEGETIVLEHCPFTSPVQLSELDFQWSVQNGNGEWANIRPDERFRVNHDGFLTIHDVQPSDSGLYRVNISNDQGSALHTVRLQVVAAGPGPDNGKLTRFANLLSNIVKGCMILSRQAETSF